MNINGLLGPSWLQNLESGVLSQVSGVANFLTHPAGAAQSSSSGSANSAASAVSSTPSSLFAPDLLGALVSAQATPPSTTQLAQGLIKRLDTNGDGQLSLAELQKGITGASGQGLANSALSAAFNQLDANGDGQLSANELASAMNGLGALLQPHSQGSSGQT